MIHNIYMLFDVVSNMFVGAMSIMVNDNVAIRSFTDLMHNPQFPYRTMAKDLKLYKLGSINTETGIIESDKTFVCDLSDLVVISGKEKNEV